MLLLVCSELAGTSRTSLGPVQGPFSVQAPAFSQLLRWLKMPRRGGRRQQHQAPDGAPPAPSQQHIGIHETSPLGNILLEKWSWGAISASLLQQFAAAATSSGCETPDVQRLSALGAHGHLPGNIHKALVRQFSKGLLTPEPYIVNVPLKVRRRTRVSVVTQPHPMNGSGRLLKLTSVLMSLDCKESKSSGSAMMAEILSFI
jgi:hypothetical protein